MRARRARRAKRAKRAGGRAAYLFPQLGFR
jgi:hypothetical protein